MHTLAAEGRNVTGYKATYDAFAAQAVQLAGELTVLDDGHIAAWKGRADAVYNGMMDLLNTLGVAKQTGFEFAGKQGLFWGLGVSAAVATTAYLVWRNKKRSRRRGR
jgi:hypothetical protein